MGWIMLFFASIGEVVGSWAMKGFALKKQWWHLAAVIGSFAFSLVLLTLSFNSIATSTAYAVWTGLGATGSAIMGILVYKDSSNFKRLFCIGLIVVGVVGLKLFG